MRLNFSPEWGTIDRSGALENDYAMEGQTNMSKQDFLEQCRQEDAFLERCRQEIGPVTIRQVAKAINFDLDVLSRMQAAYSIARERATNLTDRVSTETDIFLFGMSVGIFYGLFLSKQQEHVN